MSEYTIASETELTDPVAADYVHVYDASAAATKKLALSGFGQVGAGVVDTTATTLVVSAASHAGKVITVSSTSPIAITLPAATGTGNRYRFNLRAAATGTSHTISVANATDVISGFAHVMTSATTTDVANIIGAFKTSATSDRVTLNGTTLGGAAGDWVEFVDIKSGIFSVHAATTATGTYATPFSAAVS